MPKLRPTPTEICTLSGRDEEVVSSLARHQFLTFSQIHRLHFADRSQTPARRALWRLADKGLAGNVFERTPYGRQTVWYATAKGEVAAGLRLPGAKRRRGEHLGPGKLAHTLSVNEFCTRLVEQARRRGDEFSSEDWRNEVALRIPRQGLVIADAFFCYREADGGHAFRFLEWDTGSMPVHQVGLKIDRYRELFSSKAWKAEYRVFPKVAMVLGDRRQDERPKFLLREAGRLAVLYEGLDFMAAALAGVLVLVVFAERMLIAPSAPA